tara:strand:+ start:719 stop:994 length:276 start_codon:yes stop_codon:yes gene_type:complete
MNNSKQIIGLSLMTWAWLLLVAVTMLAWWIAEGEQKMPGSTTMAIFLTACVKIWVIGYQFMELKLAPAFLRYGFLLWLIAITCSLVFLITQ